MNYKQVFNSFFVVIFCVMFALVGCHKKEQKPSKPAVNYAAAAIPSFNSDSAYAYTERQVLLGPRIPGSTAHEKCLQYMVNEMSRWCDTVVKQPFSTVLWNGSEVKGCNVIASINLASTSRIILASHWDSRMWADHDSDLSKQNLPILGANDGAAGVGMLIEMARIMKAMPPDVGIDFIFFDIEDQGLPEWADHYEDNTWCKGSQYWSAHPHTPFYIANYGILFDMIATHTPRFTKEEVSRRYASGITNKLWTVASVLGHSDVFVDLASSAILDDHLYVNQIANIPMVDVVQSSPDGNFFDGWHTTGDDMSSVSKESLNLVADVVLHLIYTDYPCKK